MRHWMALLTITVFVLLRGELSSAIGRGPLSVTDATADPVALYSQKLHVDNVSGVNCGDECQCYVEGKCKPCSWFEMGRQVPDCLLTGYHQWAYCPQHKKRKYVSCHYHSNPAEQKAFWVFEAVVLLVGVLSYVVVQWRVQRIERMVAKRIEQQINA